MHHVSVIAYLGAYYKTPTSIVTRANSYLRILDQRFTKPHALAATADVSSSAGPMGSSTQWTRRPPPPYDGAPRTDGTKPDGSEHGKK